MSSDRSISVVIPAYDRIETLPRVLQSYAEQTLDPSAFEVVVVDDASPRPIELIVRSAQQRYPYHLRLLHHIVNQGPGVARNTGIAAAEAPLLVLACDDTYAPPSFLATHLAFHRANPDPLVALIGQVDWAPGISPTPVMQYVVSPAGGQQYAYDRIKDPENAGYFYFYGSNLSLKRTALDTQAVWFDPVFTYGNENIELGYRLEQAGLRLVFRPEARLWHDHRYSLEQFCRRQIKAGAATVQFAQKWPQLDDEVLGVARTIIRNPGLRPLAAFEERLPGLIERERVLEQSARSGDPNAVWQLGQHYLYALSVGYCCGVVDAALRDDTAALLGDSTIAVTVVIVEPQPGSDLEASLYSIERSVTADGLEVILVAISAEQAAALIPHVEGCNGRSVIAESTSPAVLKEILARARGRYLLFCQGVGFWAAPDLPRRLAAALEAGAVAAGPVLDDFSPGQDLRQVVRGPLPAQATLDELAALVTERGTGRTVPVADLNPSFILVRRDDLKASKAVRRARTLSEALRSFLVEQRRRGGKLAVAVEAFVHVSH